MRMIEKSLKTFYEGHPMAGKGKKGLSEEELAELAKEFRNRARALSQIIKAMKAKKKSKVYAMGRPMVVRGLASIDRFILSCKRDVGEY